MIPIEHYVNQSVSDFARRAQRSSVPAIGKHLSMSPQALIESLGQADHEAPHTATGRRLGVRLDHEMNMRELDRVLQNAKITAIGFAKSVCNHVVQVAQRWEQSWHAHRGVNRRLASMWGPALMRNPSRTGQRRLAPRAFSPSSARTKR